MNHTGAHTSPQPSQQRHRDSTGESEHFPECLAEPGRGDPVAALQEVRERVKLVTESGMQPEEGVKSLEAIRDTVAGLHAISASSYGHGELPLAPGEHDLWRASLGLRIDLAAAYEACTIAWSGGVPSQAAPAWEVLAIQRALRELGMAIVEHARVRIEVSPNLWRRLHALYLRAETRGIAEAAAGDSHPECDGWSSCRSLYLHALLFHRAQPYGMTAGQIAYVADWLDRWAGLATLHRNAPDASPITALVVDLGGEDGIKLLRHSQQGTDLRHVDTRQLGSKLKEAVASLRTDQDSAATGSAQDVEKAALARLMTNLYVQWCSAGTGRASPRTGAASKAMVTLSVPATHFYISGRAFRQPGQGPTREEDQDLQLFGHVTQRTMQKLVSQRSSALEPWTIANESNGGMLVLCRQPDLRTRVAHGQLLGMMRRSDKPIELVVVQWLMLAHTGELEVGVRRIEGLPQAVAVRSRSSAPRPGTQPGIHFQRALLLPAISEKSRGATLLVEPATCAAHSNVDVYVKENVSGRVLDLVDKGPNFEMFAFEKVQ